MLARRKPLGELLVENNIITNEQLQEALRLQESKGERLGQILRKLGYISEEKLYRVLQEQLRIPYIELRRYPVNPALAQLITAPVARRYRVLPIAREENQIVLAMVNPLNVFDMDEISQIVGSEVKPVLVSENDLEWALSEFLELKSSVDKAVEGLPQEIQGWPEEEIAAAKIREIVEEGPVVTLVNSIITRAVLNRASDIHIEPQEEELMVRYRIDGVLFEMLNLPRRIHPAVSSRLKIMADLDITERRLPQDGRIQMEVEGRSVDVRVSVIPTIYGEKLVLRILDKTTGFLTIPQLGFAPEIYPSFVNMLRKPHGLLLVTGPTGSGKTTTLYAIINELSVKEKNIVTIEDPVEYTIPLVNQMQVNPKIGLTFARGLRAILRQDPDIVMVGEIRDTETAQIAVQAALTGHLVLSTLHTNSAVSSVIRLIDMGVEPYLLGSCLIGVIAQRLVRNICPECKEVYQPSREILTSLRIPEEDGKVAFWRGWGCSSCRITGYQGRLALQEILIIEGELKDLITAKVPEQRLQHAALSHGMRTLREDGIEKAKRGLTTLEEVMTAVFWQD
ncbi:MAG: ATPase, T2SS/T4P/T4SS family [Bacillota bacterium]|nr:ATPase, T2SS/T4P/T4SS family [Bacillota bacterium]